jgi:hypothetical protein
VDVAVEIRSCSCGFAAEVVGTGDVEDGTASEQELMSRIENNEIVINTKSHFSSDTLRLHLIQDINTD